MASEKHVWQVGDLCQESGSDHHGIVYRVIDIELRRDGVCRAMWIKPVLGLLTPMDDMRTHEVAVAHVKPLSLVDLGLERAKFDSFLLAEARKHDGLPPLVPAEQAPGSDFEGLELLS